MKSGARYFVWWILAVLIALGFELCFANFEAYRWKNVAENLLFATGMLLTIPLFNSRKIKGILADSYFVFFVLCLFLESAFFYLFHTNFSASAIYILIETNAAESREFLGFYLDVPIICFFLALLLLCFLYFKRRKNIFRKYSLRVKAMSLSLLVGLLIFMKFSGMIDPNLPYLVGISIWDYSHEKSKMEAFNIDKPTGNFEEVNFQGKFKKNLFVLVIGESTTKRNFGLYGYYRNTTPKLKEIENELLVYWNVISPHAFTIGALQEALTLNNFQKSDESSLVQLMNQAGFKTFWLSNQRPIGPYESLVTKISKASNVVEFTNSAIAGSVTPYDEVLLSYFEKALADSAENKFIVLHILGTHMQYKNRYPENFDFFKDQPQSNFEDELAHSRINSYDNAIRYMDSFLRQVIEMSRDKHVPSYVLYFSDHGEEVYHNRYFAGHLDENPTKDMFEVPFILWRSEEFKKQDFIFEENLKTPYSMGDFIYSFADLSQIDFAGMNEEKSIFSEQFQPKKRKVGDGLDFDIYFEKD
ncbi:MAG TPA: sulfatase-like hydrolase/transferase [Flavobacteriaceae bacterium]|nr:sulfatase-like hydrolase/transferase [Flavobacteriaceae bacterium]